MQPAHASDATPSLIELCSEDSTRLPCRVGPYRLEAEIGFGSMGAVFRAIDERLARRVAVKHVSAPQPAPATDQSFWREARAVARLSHPAIVQIFDIVEDEIGGWIVMELVEGRTLASLLEEGPLSVIRALRLFAQAADGLGEAHDKGLLHRDLKAENLMVTSSGHAKLLDFGLAQNFDGAVSDTESSEGLKPEAGLLAGTPCSMSPEQALGLELDPRSDLFAFGALLYEALTGRKPFRARGLAATLHQVCFAQQQPAHELDPRIPEELSQLIDRLLQKDAEERPRDAHEVARALRLIFPGGLSRTR